MTGEAQKPGNAIATILIATSEKDRYELLCYMIRNEDYHTEMAKSKEETIAKAKSFCPELIVLDLDLKRHEGFETLRELQGEDTRGIPVILLYDGQTESSTRRALECESNVAAAISKPCHTIELSAIIRKLRQGGGSNATKER